MQTFLFVSAILMLIAIVIDMTEKMPELREKGVSLGEILRYYAVYLPYIFSLLAPFFLVVSVVYFTSKMAINSEIVAILGSGISYYRLLRPYLISALIFTGLMVLANNWLVPRTNKIKLNFLNEHIHYLASSTTGVNRTIDNSTNSWTNISMQSFSFINQEGYQFSLEIIRDNEMVYQLRAPRATWQEESKSWRFKNYDIWEINGGRQKIREGSEFDTILNFTPADFVRRLEVRETMIAEELNDFIEREKNRSSEMVPFYQVEKYNRTSNAFAILVLTFIGVAFSSRKKKGALGINLVFGVASSALFLLFLRFSTTFATNADLHPFIAVWIPNIIFGVLGVVMLRLAPK